jgi:putative membrane protein
MFQFFQRLRDQNVISGGGGSARRFGVTLVALGVAMLIFGIVFHIQYMIGLRRLRQSMREEGLVHGRTIFRRRSP